MERVWHCLFRRLECIYREVAPLLQMKEGENMTILQLKYVLAVASSPSMREAASKLYISQPALSATIRELKEELK